MGDIIISVAKNFSKTPGAGLRVEGKFSGQEFLEEHLIKAFEQAFKDGSRVTVNLDGTIGYGTAFLEQSFGGLARKFPDKPINDILEIISEEEPYLIQDVRTYVQNANQS